MKLQALNTALIIIFMSTNCSASKKHIAILSPEKKELKKHNTNDLLVSYLELAAQRQQVLSKNVANLNTPGYQAQEVYIPKDYSGINGKRTKNSKIRLRRTSNNHMSGTRKDPTDFAKVKLKDPYEIKPNGNTVSISQQMIKASENRNDYVSATKSFSTLNSLYTLVAGGVK